MQGVRKATWARGSQPSILRAALIPAKTVSGGVSDLPLGHIGLRRQRIQLGEERV
jgi:hypothetical protein